MQFPECFPNNFEQELLPVPLTHSVCDIVYRVMKLGIIDRTAFLSTHEEVLKGIRPPSVRDNKSDPSYYATSMSKLEQELQYFLGLTMRREPKAFIVKGYPEAQYGPSQLTKERVIGCETAHVDWWIYEGATPEQHFERSD